jgi:hypothetical protein
LPDAEVAVDKGVVEPEDGVGGGAVRVLHDGADAVVAPSVRTALGAVGHAGKVAVRVALVHVVGVAVLRLCGVAVAGKAMGLVAGAGSNVDGEVGEGLQWVSYLLTRGALDNGVGTYAVGYTVSAKGNASEPLG